MRTSTTVQLPVPATSADNGLGAAGHPNDETRTVSYFARFGWNWKETYMINATVRTDGSSRFARGNRYGVFPSVSAGWTISNEAFMEDTHDWLDFLKLRVSWGQVGNQNIDNYQYTAPITSSNTHYIFGNQVGADAQSGFWGAYPSRLAAVLPMKTLRGKHQSRPTSVSIHVSCGAG